MSEPSTTVPAQILLIGLNGFGRQHLRNLGRLAELGKAELIAGVDLQDPGSEIRGEIPIFTSLTEALEAGLSPDIVIVSTPIGAHFALAAEAVSAGADVLLEKPPTATLAQYEELLALSRSAGRQIQVGFQSLGSHALGAIEELLHPDDGDPGPIGELRAVGATGLWTRTESYYARAPWAGKRRLGDMDVVDGVVTNPLAHAVKTALHIAGAKTLDDVEQLSTELHHGHAIEADDTSIVQLRTTAGIPVTAALTLLAEEDRDPWITISGTEGEAVLYYTRDELVITPNPQAPGAGPESRQIFGRTDLLENLIDVRTGAVPRMLSPLVDHGAFMKVLEDVRTAEDPATIGEEYLGWMGESPERHPVVPHLENYIARAVKASPSSFSSLGAPWAATPATSGQLHVGSAEAAQRVAELRTGEDISPTDGPRPFLDEVTTLGGVVVTDQQPLDHTWHLGVSTALQDVNGHNFWGGRTYTREAGRYVWRADHGRIELHAQEISDIAGGEPEAAGGRSPGAGQQLEQQLRWVTGAGETLLQEHRTVRTTPEIPTDAAAGPEGWLLDYRFALTPAGDDPVSLGSPGSNGRVGGGYGGFFWRLPQLTDAEVFTAEAEGEEAVHGTVTDWLALTAQFQPLPSRHGHGGEATLILLREAGDTDPWFVRQASYPGLGMSLAWDAPLILQPGQTAERRIRVVVADGRLTQQQAAARAAAEEDA